MAVVVMVSGWEEKVGWAATQVTHDVSDEIFREIKRDLSRHQNTGALSRSLRMRKTKLSGRISIGTDHWRHFEYGTRAHTIRPRTKKVLRFYKDGKLVFAKVVRHPGTRAYRPIRRALYKKRPLKLVTGVV